MPFRDPEDRRRYDRERKRTLRSSGTLEPLAVPREARLRAIEDVENLLAEGVRLVLADRRASGVQKARALGYLASIGLRLIETHDLRDRMETLEQVLQARRAS